MDEGWIITTAITLGIGVISYFLKRTMNQLDCTVQQLQKPGMARYPAIRTVKRRGL